MEIKYQLVEGKQDTLGMPCYEHRFNGMIVSSDSTLIDMDFVLKSLKQAYWANTRSEATVRRAWAHSIGLGIYDEKTGTQVAMMRVVTDYAVYAHVFDVWVDPGHRGKGYSKVMMSFFMSYPELRSVIRLQLTTADAHTLYSQFGFNQLKNPERFLETWRAVDTAKKQP
jgi:GNAT superfamily N-acetyltransferase